MSLTVVPNAPTGVGAVDPDGPDAPDAGTSTGRVARLVAAARHSLDGTPGRLRAISALVVLAAVLVALGGGAALRERSSAIDSAGSASAHLVLIQRIQTNLVQADADATNSFLAYGPEPQGQRSNYLTSIRQASIDLAAAARGSSQDAAVLGQVNAALTRYTGYISSARANNLQGLVVGASFLSKASSVMDQEILAPLGTLSQADSKEVDAAYSRAAHAIWWLALVVIVGIGALVWAQVYLAWHSRRILNVPLAGSTVVLLVALIIAGGAMVLAQSKADSVRTGALARATSLSASRVAAFNAKSEESLVLINRGTGTPDDTDWKKSMAVATGSLPSGTGAAATALNNYTTQHQQIRASDDQGRWQKARQQAIDIRAGSANVAFQTYSDDTATALNVQAKQAASGLASAGDTLLPAGILVVLVGLLAAIGALWGVWLRLDEYR